MTAVLVIFALILGFILGINAAILGAVYFYLLNEDKKEIDEMIDRATPKKDPSDEIGEHFDAQSRYTIIDHS